MPNFAATPFNKVSKDGDTMTGPLLIQAVLAHLGVNDFRIQAYGTNYYLLCNATFSAGNFHPIDNTKPCIQVKLSQVTGGIIFYYGTATTDPVAWTTVYEFAETFSRPGSDLLMHAGKKVDGVDISSDVALLAGAQFTGDSGLTKVDPAFNLNDAIVQEVGDTINICVNAKYDGANWNRLNIAKESIRLCLRGNRSFELYVENPGANPITWQTHAAMTAGGVTKLYDHLYVEKSGGRIKLYDQNMHDYIGMFMLGGNCYFQTPDFNRSQTSRTACLLIINHSGGFTFRYAPAGVNPIVFTDIFIIAKDGDVSCIGDIGMVAGKTVDGVDVSSHDHTGGAAGTGVPSNGLTTATGYMNGNINPGARVDVSLNDYCFAPQVWSTWNDVSIETYTGAWSATDTCRFGIKNNGAGVTEYRVQWRYITP